MLEIIHRFDIIRSHKKQMDKGNCGVPITSALRLLRIIIFYVSLGESQQIFLLYSAHQKEVL